MFTTNKKRWVERLNGWIRKMQTKSEIWCNQSSWQEGSECASLDVFQLLSPGLLTAYKKFDHPTHRRKPSCPFDIYFPVTGSSTDTGNPSMPHGLHKSSTLHWKLPRGPLLRHLLPLRISLPSTSPNISATVPGSRTCHETPEGPGVVA
jgi:hypothetical protein